MFLCLHPEFELSKCIPLEVIEGDIYWFYLRLDLVNDFPKVLYSNLTRLVTLEKPEFVLLLIKIAVNCCDRALILQILLVPPLKDTFTSPWMWLRKPDVHVTADVGCEKKWEWLEEAYKANFSVMCFDLVD